MTDRTRWRILHDEVTGAVRHPNEVLIIDPTIEFRDMASSCASNLRSDDRTKDCRICEGRIGNPCDFSVLRRFSLIPGP